ncbi:MAG: alpha/beta fold hydrolase [Saprospiraceae bacterium]|nr:alpha/beta fold hydrolase [Saprospiraceae bacterium]
MKSILIGLLLICTVSFIGNAQIVKLRSSEGYVQTDDYVKLHYQFLGEGKDTIVVVHGGGTFGSAYLVPDLTPLAAHHAILFFDQAGAGYSTVVKDTARYSMNSTLKDIEVIRKHFKLKKLNLLGHSTGGLICGFYATTYPDQVKSMMLMAPIPASAAMTNGWVNKNDSLTTLLLEQNGKMYDNNPSDTTKACWDYYSLWIRGYASSYVEGRNIWGNICNCTQANLKSPFSYYKMKSIGNWDITPQLANVKAPVLLLVGDNDAIPFASFENWNKSLSNSSLLNFKGAGHLPNADNPAAFFLAVETFLQGKTPNESVMEAFGAGVVLPNDLKGSFYLRARASVIEVENELVRLANNAEWDEMSNLYTSDGVIYPPGAPPIMGRNAIATFWRTVSTRGMHSLQLHLVDLILSGDLLMANGKYTMRNKQNEILDLGKFMAIYRKEKNEWLLQTDMFNSNLETRSPLEIPDYLMLKK